MTNQILITVQEACARKICDYGKGKDIDMVRK